MVVPKTLILLTALATARAIVVPRQANSSGTLPGDPCDDAGSIICGVGADAVCTKIMSDINSCGACVHECQAGQSCENGICTNKKCQPGWEHCLFSPDCVDLQNDNQHCGNCDSQCPPGLTCQGGKCDTPPGSSTPTGETKDPVPPPTPTPSSPAPEPTPGGNGTIGDACDLHAHPGGILCPGAGGSLKCVDFTFDPSNCGGCSAQDPKFQCANGSSCMAGKCVPAEPSQPEKPEKPEEPEIGLGVKCNYGSPGFMYCSPASGRGFECYNTLNDNRHCGGCGNDCRPGENCVDGTCAPPGGCGAQTYCPGSANGSCVNLDNDNSNCGACGKFCVAGKNCVGGKCL